MIMRTYIYWSLFANRLQLNGRYTFCILLSVWVRGVTDLSTLHFVQGQRKPSQPYGNSNININNNNNNLAVALPQGGSLSTVPGSKGVKSHLEACVR